MPASGTTLLIYPIGYPGSHNDEDFYAEEFRIQYALHPMVVTMTKIFMPYNSGFNMPTIPFHCTLVQGLTSLENVHNMF